MFKRVSLAWEILCPVRRAGLPAALLSHKITYKLGMASFFEEVLSSMLVQCALSAFCCTEAQCMCVWELCVVRLGVVVWEQAGGLLY